MEEEVIILINKASRLLNQLKYAEDVLRLGTDSYRKLQDLIDTVERLQEKTI